MDWKDCNYKQIAELISEAEIDKIIDVMVENSDINGKFYESYKVEEFLKSYVHNFDIINIIEETARREIKNTLDDNKDSIGYHQCGKRRRTRKRIVLDDLDDLNIELRKEQICESILCNIAKEAQKKRASRFFNRLHNGDNIILNSYDQQYTFIDNIEFLKDGGWGVANKEGQILIGNHLIQRPSKTMSLFNKRNCPYRLIQDRDTELYGVLSLLTFNEVIHCLYDKIEVVEYWQDNDKKFILKTKKNDKWGCYDENCALIIDCRYDDIFISSGWIEGCRDGNFLYPEIDYNKYGSIYEGVKDLYDSEGNLMLGGYNNFEYDYRHYLKFYIGTEYEEYFVKQTDFYDNEIELSRYKLNYDNSICLVLDRHFRTITKCNGHYLHIPLGKVFQSQQDIIDYFPSDFLFPGEVDLSDFNTFVYLKKENRDKFLISDYIEGYNAELFDECVSEPGRWVDTFIEDDEVIIIKVDNGNLSWRYKVNEIACLSHYRLLYRIGEKVGFYSKDGVSDAIYSAVTTDRNENKTYVAQILRKRIERNGELWNPNFIPHKQYTIQYFELMESGELHKMEDDWKVFNPQKHKWFPADFLEMNGLVDYDYGYYGGDSILSYEKYGGYNGYDDDTIDYGFDGFPEATWNVD